MGTPILLKLIIDYMQSPYGHDGGMVYGMSLVVLYIIIDIFGVLIEEQACFMQMILGVRTKNAISQMIYEKTLKISNASNKKFTEAEIINFIQIDSDKILTL